MKITALLANQSRSAAFYSITLGLLTIGSSPLAISGAPSAVIERLTARLVRNGSNPSLIHVLEETPSGQRLLEALTGPRPAAATPRGEWTRQAVLSLERSNQEGLARTLESRLDAIESAWIKSMEKTPLDDAARSIETIGNELLTFEFFHSPSRANTLGANRIQNFRFTRSLEEFNATLQNAELEIQSLRENAVRLGEDRAHLKIPSTLVAYDHLSRLLPELPFQLKPREVLEVLANPEAETTIQQLRALLVRISGLQTRNLHLTTSELIRVAARETLAGKVPVGQISQRISEFLGEINPVRTTAHLPQNRLQRLLGELTVQEVNELVHGGSPLAPTRESLLGKYIAITRATTQVKEFPIYADDGTILGHTRRLVVSVSADSLAEFNRLFQREEFMTVTGHAYLSHNGRVNSYTFLDQEFRLPSSEFTPMPWVHLSSTEGQRLTQYLKFFSKMSQEGHVDWNRNHLKYTPWSLPGYCATGAYRGCTRWIGDMPIGDVRVLEYSFPGAVDASAIHYYGATHLDPTPRVQHLSQYHHPDLFVHQVWKVPGNMQFAEAIGLKVENLGGNFANPGWLIASLLGPAPVERVPVVFVSRPDHRVAFPAAWTPRYENRH